MTIQEKMLLEIEKQTELKKKEYEEI